MKSRPLTTHQTVVLCIISTMRLGVCFLSFLVLTASIHTLSAQSTDTLPAREQIQSDSISTNVKSEKNGLLKVLFSPQPYPTPGRALAYSLILPGAGQFYNKKYVKVGLVYGGFAALFAGINWQRDREDRFQTALELRLADLPHEFSGTSIDSERALRSRRDQYRKNRELMTIGVGIFYLLNGLDAYVDAHLMQFDVSDDLSLHLSPAITPAGFGISLQAFPRPTPSTPLFHH